MFVLTLSLKAPLGRKDTGRLGLKPLMLQGQNTAHSEHKKSMVTLCTTNIVLTLLSKSQAEKHRSQSCSCKDAWGQMRVTKILTFVSGMSSHFVQVSMPSVHCAGGMSHSGVNYWIQSFWVFLTGDPVHAVLWILKSGHRSLSFPLDRKFKGT